MLNQDVIQKNTKALADEQLRQRQNTELLKARVAKLEQIVMAQSQEIQSLRVMVATKMSTGPTA